jgi:hypothetical protein
MGKSHKRTTRGDHYQAMAAGYQLLKSPLADSYNAAAEHYRERDPPSDPRPDRADGSGSRREGRRD